MGRRARTLSLLALLVLALGLLPGREARGRGWGMRVQPSAGASGGRADRRGAGSALEAARTARRALIGCAESERERLRARAIAAYESVSRAPGVAALERVEAAFRAGELARAGGDGARARSAFEHAVALCAGPFSWRARLELGHLARRSGDAERAARHYEDLLLERCDDPYIVDETLFWLARARFESGRVPSAIDLLQHLEARSVSLPLRARVQRELARLGHATQVE